MYTIKHRFQYVSPFVIALCVIAVVVGGLLATPRVGISQAEALATKGFGPVLFRFETAKGEWPATVPPSVTLHARLEDTGRDLFIASGVQGMLHCWQQPTRR
ncbi:MAG: hypothetical protein IPK16_31930 [Anaerolineales bacterium]|nr:hypothetical protein [Anaerolineales bacterium]